MRSSGGGEDIDDESQITFDDNDIETHCEIGMSYVLIDKPK